MMDEAHVQQRLRGQNQMSQRPRDWYDVMQACLNGHVITSEVTAQPQEQKKHCPQCGEPTITKCPNCGTEIEGYLHSPGFFPAHPAEPPANCHECGAAYPWTERRKNTTTAGPAVVTEGALTKKIFVVHGHDNEMKQAVARVLQNLGLEPIILHERPNQGKTLIEKFERDADVQVRSYSAFPRRYGIRTNC